MEHAVVVPRNRLEGGRHNKAKVLQLSLHDKLTLLQRQRLGVTVECKVFFLVDLLWEVLSDCCVCCEREGAGCRQIAE